MAKLAGGVAVIKVGAATEVEMKEKKARVEDALHATRAAVEEGIVAGGGVAYLRARANLKNLKGDNADQDAGIKIVLRALEEPLRQIVDNAGDEPSVVVNKVVEGKGNYGFNAQTAEYGDLVEMGVVDPTKVDALRAAKRGVGRFAAADDRSDGRRAAEGRKGHGRRWRRRHGWHGRHGRHGHVTESAGRGWRLLATSSVCHAKPRFGGALSLGRATYAAACVGLPERCICLLGQQATRKRIPK